MLSLRLSSFSQPARRSLGSAATLFLLLGLAACSSAPKKTELPPTADAASKEVQILTGTAPRANRTPMDPAFVCLSERLQQQRAKVFSVAVGDVKDYTGKYSQTEGNAITQGGT